MIEYINIAISIIAIAIALISLYFSWVRMRKERPILSHEIFSCLHKVAENGKSTNLELVFRLHNRGDRGTKLTKIEVSVHDLTGAEHHSYEEWSMQLDAHTSTEKVRSFFYFAPSFQYGPKMTCNFKIYHTDKAYSFECESQEAGQYLQSVHVGSWFA